MDSGTDYESLPDLVSVEGDSQDSLSEPPSLIAANSLGESCSDSKCSSWSDGDFDPLEEKVVIEITESSEESDDNECEEEECAADISEHEIESTNTQGEETSQNRRSRSPSVNSRKKAVMEQLDFQRSQREREKEKRKDLRHQHDVDKSVEIANWVGAQLHADLADKRQKMREKAGLVQDNRPERVGRCALRVGGLVDGADCLIDHVHYTITSEHRRIRLKCTDGCVVNYHLECWQHIKKEMNQLNFKAYQKVNRNIAAGVPCPTNACDGKVLEAVTEKEQDGEMLATVVYEAPEEVRKARKEARKKGKKERSKHRIQEQHKEDGAKQTGKEPAKEPARKEESQKEDSDKKPTQSKPKPPPPEPKPAPDNPVDTEHALQVLQKLEKATLVEHHKDDDDELMGDLFKGRKGKAKKQKPKKLHLTQFNAKQKFKRKGQGRLQTEEMAEGEVEDPCARTESSNAPPSPSGSGNASNDEGAAPPLTQEETELALKALKKGDAGDHWEPHWTCICVEGWEGALDEDIVSALEGVCDCTQIVQYECFPSLKIHVLDFGSWDEAAAAASEIRGQVLNGCKLWAAPMNEFPSQRALQRALESMQTVSPMKSPVRDTHTSPEKHVSPNKRGVGDAFLDPLGGMKFPGAGSGSGAVQSECSVEPESVQEGNKSPPLQPQEHDQESSGNTAGGWFPENLGDFRPEFHRNNEAQDAVCRGGFGEYHGWGQVSAGPSIKAGWEDNTQQAERPPPCTFSTQRMLNMPAFEFFGGLSALTNQQPTSKRDMESTKEKNEPEQGSTNQLPVPPPPPPPPPPRPDPSPPAVDVNQPGLDQLEDQCDSWVVLDNGTVIEKENAEHGNFEGPGRVAPPVVRSVVSALRPTSAALDSVLYNVYNVDVGNTGEKETVVGVEKTGEGGGCAEMDGERWAREVDSAHIVACKRSQLDECYANGGEVCIPLKTFRENKVEDTTALFFIDISEPQDMILRGVWRAMLKEKAVDDIPWELVIHKPPVHFNLRPDFKVVFWPYDADQLRRLAEGSVYLSCEESKLLIKLFINGERDIEKEQEDKVVTMFTRLLCGPESLAFTTEQKKSDAKQSEGCEAWCTLEERGLGRSGLGGPTDAAPIKRLFPFLSESTHVDPESVIVNEKLGNDPQPRTAAVDYESMKNIVGGGASRAPPGFPENSRFAMQFSPIEPKGDKKGGVKVEKVERERVDAGKYLPPHLRR